MYDINALPSIIPIGKQGEGDVTPIEFDVSDWVADYPGLPISISITDPQDSTNAIPFLAAGVTLSGNTLTWLVGRDATQHAGLGTVVVRCADGGTDKRSARTQILIDVGHGAASEAPEPMADWLAEADALRQEVADGAAAAADSADTATTKAGEAASSAQAASTSAGLADTAKQAAEAARDTAVTKAGEAEQSAQGAAQSAAVYGALAGTVAGHTTQLADNTTKINEKTGYGVLSGLVVSAQTIPNMTVKTSSGVAYMADGTRHAPVAVAAIAVIPADAINSRIDIVYLSSAGAVSYLAGTAKTSPVAPTTPMGGLLLAEISVAANQTAIQAANIALRKKNLWVEDWVKPTLVNGWAAYNDVQYPVKYFKDIFGFVHMRGFLASGQPNTVAFSLPEGYRPVNTVMVPVAMGSYSANVCNIASTGLVFPAVTNYTSWVSMDDVSFYAG